MTKQDWPAFCTIVNNADEVIRAGSRSAGALVLMFDALAELTLQQVTRAVAEHVKTSPYPVKPCDVLRLALGDSKDLSALAWATFLGAIRDYGNFESIRFPEPAYHYAIAQKGGWATYALEIGMLDERELQFREKSFRELFEIGSRVASWKQEPNKVRVAAYLVGECERNNRALGYAAPDVIEIATGQKIRREDLGIGEGAENRPISLPIPALKAV